MTPSSLVRVLCVAVLGISLVAMGYAELVLHRTLDQPHAFLRVRADLKHFTYLDSEGVVFQRTRIDCGPAVLRMFLLRTGHDVPLEQLEKETLDDPKGTSVQRMLDALRENGVLAHAARLKQSEWQRVSPPFIGLIDGNHYILVASRLGPDFEILDPAIGRGRITSSNLFHFSEGVVIEEGP